MPASKQLAQFYGLSRLLWTILMCFATGPEKPCSTTLSVFTSSCNEVDSDANHGLLHHIASYPTPAHLVAAGNPLGKVLYDYHLRVWLWTIWQVSILSEGRFRARSHLDNLLGFHVQCWAVVIRVALPLLPE